MEYYDSYDPHMANWRTLVGCGSLKYAEFLCAERQNVATLRRNGSKRPSAWPRLASKSYHVLEHQDLL